MKKHYLTTGILSAALFGAALMTHTAKSQTTDAPAPAPVEKEAAPVAPKTAQQTFEAMLGAIEDNNRAAFVAFADTRFKAALTPPQFQSVVDQIAPRLQAGHALKYLGEMNQAGFVVYLWRVRFDDGGDDFLAQMSVKDEKVGGFLLR